MRKRFGQCGFRMTVAREAVMDVFADSQEHLSAEDVYMLLHQTHPEIGLTTVYRTLELLTANKIICRFDFGHGRAKYELAEEYSSKPHHHHLICEKCHKIIDYSDFLDSERDYIRKAEEELQKKHGFSISSHIIHFHGLCPGCLEK